MVEPFKRVINITPDPLHVIFNGDQVVKYESESPTFFTGPHGIDLASIVLYSCDQFETDKPKLRETISNEFSSSNWKKTIIVPKNSMIVTNALVAGIICEIGVSVVFPGRGDLTIASPIPKDEDKQHVYGHPLLCRGFSIFHDGRHKLST